MVLQHSQAFTFNNSDSVAFASVRNQRFCFTGRQRHPVATNCISAQCLSFLANLQQHLTNSLLVCNKDFFNLIFLVMCIMNNSFA